MSIEKPLRVAMIGLRHPHVGSLDPARPSPGYIHTFKQIPDVQVVAYCEDSDPLLLGPSARVRSKCPHLRKRGRTLGERGICAGVRRAAGE